MMATNIPNSKPIEFTRSMLYNPEYKELKGSGTYPYITDEVDYSNTNIESLAYPEIVNTFFNRDKFINMVSNARGKQDNADKLDKQKTLETNVMKMLALLFPTKYFTVNNHKQSIELLEPGIATHYKHSIFYNPLKTFSSYVNINSKPYTVTEVIWLNDLLNHPSYRKLLEEVYNLNRSLNTYKAEIIGKITKVKGNILREIDAIETEITNGITDGMQGKANVAKSPYASGSNYDALFAVLFVNKTLKGEIANDVLLQNINDEIKTIAHNNYAGKETRTPNIYVPSTLKDLYAGVKSIDSKPTDEYTRLKTILDKMRQADITSALSKIIKTTHVKDALSLTSHVENLFNRNMIKDGADLIEQYLIANNIDLSKQSNSRTDNQIISQFKYNVQYKYIRPTLTTTNIELQHYIDAITPEIANEWIKQFEQIYNKYILKFKGATIDTHLLNLNVTNINMEKSGTSVPTKEIYIKLKLIDGEVNDTNKSDIYCPITNDILGNELVNLINNKTDNANILNEEEAMFSVNTKKTSFNYNNKQNNTPTNANIQPSNKQYNLGNQNNPLDNYKLNANKQPEITPDAYNKFGSIIFNNANKRDFGKIIDEIQPFSSDIRLDPGSILDFITKTYADSISGNKDQYIELPNLPNAINEWSKNVVRNNTILEDKLKLMKSTLDTNYDIIKTKVSGDNQIVDNKYRAKLSYQLAIIGLYVHIVNLLLTNELGKKIVATSRGGKPHKKRRHKTIKYKSKSIYKTHKRRNF
jgi:hypothetical protein